MSFNFAPGFVRLRATIVPVFFPREKRRYSTNAGTVQTQVQSKRTVYSCSIKGFPIEITMANILENILDPAK